MAVLLGWQTKAVAGVSGAQPHGPFRLYYPTGTMWVRGSYDRGRRLDDWQAFLPMVSRCNPKGAVAQ